MTFSFTVCAVAEPGKLAVKTISLTPEKKRSYDKVTHWRFRPENYDSCAALRVRLMNLMQLPYLMIVRGQPRDDLDLSKVHVRRWAGADKTLVSVDRAWLAIDVDGVEVPSPYGDADQLGQAAEYIRDRLLPGEFADVQMIACATASTGLTLGNANNVIVDTSAATTATVNITVGTGLNKITVGNGLSATDSVYNITLGAHTGAEAIYANNSGGANYATVMNNVITGALTGDKIYFADTASTATGTLTALATVASANSEASAITALITGVDAAGANKAAYGVYNGNTYFAEESAAAGAATVTLVKIVGVHTMSATNDAGAGFDYITLLS